MTMELFDGIDFNQNEAQNLRLQNLASDPGSPVLGLIYYSTAGTDHIRAYIDGSWEDIPRMIDVTASGISANLVDTKGDLIVATADNAVDNLPAGANDTVLVAASGQTMGMLWQKLVNANVDAAAAIAYSKLNLATSIVNADIAAGAAIAYSKLNLAGAVLNADLAGSIAYSKLVLGNSVVNADIAAAAAIALSKLATQNSMTIVGNNTGGAAVPTALTAAQVKTLLAIVAADISDFNTAVRTNRLDQMTAPTASVAMGSQKFTGMADGTAVTDSATWGQVQAIIEGKEWKQETAETATTGALPNTPTYNSGAGTLTAGSNTTLAAQDGVTLAVGDSILVKNQASTFQNGIYTMTATGSGAAPWVLTRRADASTAAELTKGATIFISSASQVESGRTYTQTAALANLTSDAQTWTLTGDSTTVYTADGTTVTLSGTQFSVTTGGISNAQVNAAAAIARSKLDFGSGLVNADIAAGAAIAYSKLNLATSILNADINAAAAIAYSKLNLATSIVNGDINAAAAIAYSKLNLAGAIKAADIDGTAVVSGGGTVRVARIWEDTITGGATTEVVTHNLGTRAVQVALINPSTPWDEVLVTTERTSTNTVTLRSSANLPAGYIVSVIG